MKEITSTVVINDTEGRRTSDTQAAASSKRKENPNESV